MLRQINAEESADLRRRVLRGGRDHPPLGDVGPGDYHVGVFDGARLVATGNIRPEPSAMIDESYWRIRGMATEPDQRGRGLGGQVLTALLDHARAHGGGGVWANARTPARAFYERAGFVVEGEEWVDPDIGPHVRMWIGV